MNALVSIAMILEPETLPAIPENVLTPALVFAPGGVESLVSKLEAEVRATPRDMSTDKGRDAIKALAYKVARSKTALDDMGKELVADIKKKSGAIDAERRVIRERLDALRDEVRAPLTAWEDAETARVDGHEHTLVAIIESPRFAATVPSANVIAQRLAEVREMFAREWQEFGERAEAAATDALMTLETMLATAKQAEADAAELAELRRLKAERDAADQAAAEAKAEADRKAQEAEAQAERDRLRAEQAKRDQEVAVSRAIEEANAAAAAEIAKAEQARRGAEAQAERLAQEAAAFAASEANRIKLAKRNAEIAAAKAVEDERQRVAAQAAAEKAAAAEREANTRHRNKVHKKISDALSAIIGEDSDVEGPAAIEAAETIIAAIVAGDIPHVSITY